ncbi:family 76 glycoside hydrolase [Cryphonectria parasitica EP155]|uniref:Mannan endo-1,6-alpha-mannosidase n=1 Tax=Cryphonectria parasitica (strain ATCC 38755 / EP155) TaxID=660469 RepID=A0A9P4XW58_CRYP1|nr:family 76 glycoside hydrolase [Cryphonectria parasitica EP155]KAF3762016.1 family 76 glycoside hydrolase [Cryphonectria parasitica EP155]
MLQNLRCLGIVSFAHAATAALTLNVDEPQSIRDNAALVAYDLLATFYQGNQTGKIPGILPGPPPDGDYYWWQGGALWGTMVDYWHYTGDESYVNTTKEALLFQTGPDNNYMHPNWTASLGNDDQAFWGLSAMLAAETLFPDPPADDARQWLALAQAVFNTQAHPDRHDDTCNGGLRWQIPVHNNGYNYKNTISNACFFNMGARLARYTSNSSYYSWAYDTYDWLKKLQYIDDEYNVYDGAHVGTNCTDVNKAQFSYNVGMLLQGAAFMYNYTAGQTDNTTMSNGETAFWEGEVNSLLNGTLRVFFPDDIAHEVACEDGGTCTSDMLSFKGYVARWLAMTTQLAPFTRDRIMKVLRTSAQAAVKTCTGGTSGRMCGFKWHQQTWDNTIGAGQQMNVLATLVSLLATNTAETVAGGDGGAPVTNSTGGTSTGDSAAGYGDKPWEQVLKPITAGDKAGAAILTFVLLSSFTAASVWVSLDDSVAFGSWGFGKA